MDSPISPDHDLRLVFSELVDASVVRHVTSMGDDDVKLYLTDLLVEFVRTDSIYKVRGPEGRQVLSVSEMVAEADIRVGAESFERERQVHKHIGDFILFWHGVYPEYLRRLRLESGVDFACDYPSQAKQSYHLVSTFDAPPHDEEARTFAKLSDGFDDYAFCLGDVGRKVMLPFGGNA